MSGLSEKETVLFSRAESAPGQDSLQQVYDAASGTVEQKFEAVRPYAISVLEHSHQNDQEFEEETELGSGAQSLSPAAPGIETAGETFAQRMRAGGGNADLEPNWLDQFLSCSYRKDTGSVFRITNMAMLADIVTGNTSFAHMYLGERLCASVDVDNAAGAWGDAEGGTGGPTADPQAGEVVVIYEVGGDPNQPIARGRMAEDHTTGNSILVRLDRNERAIPLSGMNIRVTLGGGGFAYSLLSEDMPLAFVTYFKNDAGTAELRCFQQSGASLAGRKVVGQVSTAIGSGYDAPVAHGIALIPDSRASIELDVTGAGWTNGVPGVGKVVQRLDHVSNVIAAGKILAVDGNKITVKPFRLFGQFEAGGRLGTLNDAGAFTAADQSGAPTPFGSPTRTFWSVVSGFRKRTLGARGNAVIALESGKPGRVNFEFEGGGGVTEDEIPIPTKLSLPNYPAPRWEGGVAEINGKRYTINQMQFDLGAAVQRTENSNAPGGVEGASTEERSPTMTATVRRLGSTDPWEVFRREARRVVAGAVVGKTLGDMYSVVATNLQVQQHSDSAESGRINANLTFRANGSPADDEFIIHLM